MLLLHVDQLRSCEVAVLRIVHVMSVSDDRAS
jgi:hypothetical protein